MAGVNAGSGMKDISVLSLLWMFGVDKVVLLCKLLMTLSKGF